METHVRNNLGNDSSTFASVAFGKTIVLRPASFKKLDSLYEIKYQNEENAIYDPELEYIISSQLNIVQNDTSRIRYLEQFIFSFDETRDSLNIQIQKERRYVDMEIILDQQLNVLSDRINSTILIPDSLDPQYQRYLFEESFLYPGSFATEEEQLFYQFFKEGTENLVGTEKDELILHTLRVMSIAYSKKTLLTAKILYKMAQLELDKKYPGRKNELVTEVYTTASTPSEPTGYWFSVTFEHPLKIVMTEVFFRFDPYFRIISMNEI